MNNNLAFTLSIFISLSLISCKSNTNLSNNNDNNTHITDFELIHENPANNTKIRINSPKARLDSSTQNIQIFKNEIEIINQPDKIIKIQSGNATINNATKFISAANNVIISDSEQPINSIETRQLYWDLNDSIINLDNELSINLPNTNIYSKKGNYDLNLDLVYLHEVLLTRTINTIDGFRSYEITITADKSKWLKEHNSLEFTSDNGQVETTIDLFNN